MTELDKAAHSHPLFLEGQFAQNTLFGAEYKHLRRNRYSNNKPSNDSQWASSVVAEAAVGAVASVAALVVVAAALVAAAARGAVVVVVSHEFTQF